VGQRLGPRVSRAEEHDERNDFLKRPPGTGGPRSSSPPRKPGSTSCEARPDEATAAAHYGAPMTRASELEMRTKQQEAEEHLTIATTMSREVGMTYWLEKAESEMRELA
jgi:hypothetical protein